MKLNLYPWLRWTIITPIIILTLLFNSCAPVQTQAPTPTTFGDTAIAPECKKLGQPDPFWLGELDFFIPSVHEMESFRYRTVIRHTTADGYAENELSLEVEGEHSGLLGREKEFLTITTQMYEKSHTKLTDLRTRDHTEAIVSDGAFWIQTQESKNWIAFQPALSNELLNLADIFSPPVLLEIIGTGDAPIPLMEQKEMLDGREVIHRCWIPQSFGDGNFNAYWQIFKEWGRFYSVAEVHLWTAKDDTQLVRLVISGKYMGHGPVGYIFEPHVPTEFLLWMDILEGSPPIEIEPPTDIALVLPGPPATPTVNAPYNELPLPTDAILTGTFEERLEEIFADPDETGRTGIPSEYLLYSGEFSYNALTIYTGEGWPSNPPKLQPTYHTGSGFTDTLTFYPRTYNYQRINQFKFVSLVARRYEDRV